ncbi:MAG: hypothetical protein SFX73_25040 [Kofleriaceae bacterium]|nr:hypothetical protein [Kofleriaceae bacterium]
MSRTWAFAAGLSVSLPQLAAAAPVFVEGVVQETTSRWTEDGDRIVTEATVQTPDGPVVVSQLGGHVDGLTMRQFPGPEPLLPGMRVAIEAHRAADLSQRVHTLVDDVKVVAWPPGYVRTGPTKAGNYLYWESGCVFVRVDAAGTKQLPGDTEFEVVNAAIETWNAAAQGCSYLEIVLEDPKEMEVGNDRVNLIKFRDATWCRPATTKDPARCYADSAAGITTAVYVDDAESDRDGAIVDADIEINGKNFAIADMGMSLGTASCKADLLNTLTHELGHLLGLEHPCLTAGDPGRLDNLGRPVPLCSQTNDPAITEATMFNYQECEETKKATLEAEDIAGLCGIYPKSEDPGTCEAVSTKGATCVGCSSGDRPVPAMVLFALTAMLLGRRPRRYRR